jgi:hypothetical protein
MISNQPVRAGDPSQFHLRPIYKSGRRNKGKLRSSQIRVSPACGGTEAKAQRSTTEKSGREAGGMRSKYNE